MTNFTKLESTLEVTFSNKVLLEQALTHRSYLNEANVSHASNERLEFLGDAILSFIVSSYLYNHFLTKPEGELTNIRSAIVRTQTLASVAKKLHLGDFLLLSRGEEESGGRNNTSLLADCFEAIVGAIYTNAGLDQAQNFIHTHLLPLLPDIIKQRSYLDYKSQFQEKVQDIYRMSPIYKVINQEGPDHAKTFFVAVYVNDEKYGEGKGKSKQEAEQMAAANALEKWGEIR